MAIEPLAQTDADEHCNEKHRGGYSDDLNHVTLKNPAKQGVVVIFR